MSYYRDIPQNNWNNAKSLRRIPTKAERKLWNAIRRNALGTHFRRQYPIGHFIVDFAAANEKLVIEVDGDVHANPENIISDNLRSEFLRSEGFTILRFTNKDVLFGLEHVLMEIERHLKQTPPLSPPLFAEGNS